MRMIRHGASLSVHTPAKLNLALKILGRREDGFHDLETLMVSINLFDTLSFSPSDGNRVVFALASPHSSIPTDESNLVVRAAKLLRERLGVDTSIKISLRKQIPSQAGMGGGSSDAAATLVALNEIWNLRLSSKDLHLFAAQLGSDVNFFLDSSPAAICTGRGEQIAPVRINRRLDIVVVKPNTGLSTADVFRKWHEVDPKSQVVQDPPKIVQSLNIRPLHKIRNHISNELESPAIQLNREIRNALTQIRNQQVVVTSMTGSGSACFGICRSMREARRVADRLTALRIGHVWATSTGV